MDANDEIARLRAERDRAIEAATYFQVIYARPPVELPEAVIHAIRWLRPDITVNPVVAAALAEHDRRAKGE